MGCTKSVMHDTQIAQNTSPQIVQNTEAQTQIVQNKKVLQNLQQSTVENKASMAEYINSTYAFSLSYPKDDWIIDENPKSKYIKVQFISKERQKWLQETGGYDMSEADIFINVYDSVADLPRNKLGQLPLKEWITKQASGAGMFDLQEIMFANSTAFVAFYGSGDAADPVIFVEHNKKIYRIDITRVSDDDPRNEQIEKIVQTFKFTN